MSKRLLEELGRLIWFRIRDGEILSIRQGEVTLTDCTLLELRRANPASVQVRKVPLSEEKRSGADIDLFVGPIRGLYRRYLLQAKRVNTSSGRYDSLGHSVNGTPQIDLLEAAGIQYGALPLYTLFNYRPGDAHDALWHCCEARRDEELFGWSVATCELVRRSMAERKRTFAFMHADPACRPVRCLLCPNLAYKSVQRQNVKDTSQTDRTGRPIECCYTYESLPPWVTMALASDREWDIPDPSQVTPGRFLVLVRGEAQYAGGELTK